MDPCDYRMAALYNNQAFLYSATCRLKEALSLLDLPDGLPDSYYAYICETTALSLEQLKYPQESRQLFEFAREFYEKTKRNRIS